MPSTTNSFSTLILLIESDVGTLVHSFTLQETSMNITDTNNNIIFFIVILL